MAGGSTVKRRGSREAWNGDLLRRVKEGDESAPAAVLRKTFDSQCVPGRELFAL